MKAEFLWTVIRMMLNDNTYLIDVLLNYPEVQKEFRRFYAIEQEHIDAYYKARTPPIDEEEYARWREEMNEVGSPSVFEVLENAIEACRKDCNGFISNVARSSHGIELT